jgi:monolysocardiolipin acyltransferase
MDFCLARLREGNWLHLYPEGKVNAEKVYLRYKWGVGRLISECRPLPIVIPIYHLGMDCILPNKLPYIPHFGQKVTICIGNPISMEDTVKILEDSGASEEEKRKTLTSVIQVEMEKLRVEAEIMHAKHQYGYG